jgi:hypothetical protein
MKTTAFRGGTRLLTSWLFLHALQDAQFAPLVFKVLMGLDGFLYLCFRLKENVTVPARIEEKNQQQPFRPCLDFPLITKLRDTKVKIHERDNKFWDEGNE